MEDMEELQKYTYRCRIIRVVDGDTLDLRVDLRSQRTLDLGFRTYISVDIGDPYIVDRFRLWHPDGRFNADESNTESGQNATEFVESWVNSYGPDMIVKTHKDKRGSFGRWLAEITNCDGANLTEELLIRNLATVK